MQLSKEAKVGLLATTALTIVYLGLNFLKDRKIFSPENTYYTVYKHSGGLNTASPVLINGMHVGKITHVAPDDQHNARVTFEVSKDIKLTSATEAHLVSRGLLGTKAIELFIKEGDILKNHALVPGQIEQSLTEAFTESALPTLNEAKDISLLASQFMASLVENTERINATFANLEAITRQFREVVNENHQGINSLTRHMTEISGALSDDQNGVGPLLTKLNQLIKGVQGQEVKEIAAKLDNILGSIEKVIDKTEQGKSSLNRLLHDDDLYSNLNQTLLNLDELLVDLKTHPWRYVNFSVFGGKPSRKEANAP
ncbi:MAG: MlaD family protein [Roseivirga sp.]